MKARGACVAFFLSAGLTAAPITITSGSMVITGNLSGSFHLVSDSFDISGSLINAEEEPIFTPLPFLPLGSPVDPQLLGNQVQPYTGSGTIDRVNYPSLYFGVLTCESCSGPASDFEFSGPEAPLGFPVFTAPFRMGGTVSVYPTFAQSAGNCLLCAVPWTGAGIETIHSQLLPSDYYAYAPPVEFDFVPEPGSVLLTALGGAVFVFAAGRALARKEAVPSCGRKHMKG